MGLAQCLLICFSFINNIFQHFPRIVPVKADIQAHTIIIIGPAQPVLATADGSARTPLPVISPTINKHEVKTVKPDSFESELCDLIFSFFLSGNNSKPLSAITLALKTK